MIATRTAQALYIVSKRAKQHAAAAEKAHSASQYDRAREEREEKGRLYSLKANALEQLQGDAERIALHEIDNSSYYCFYFQDEAETAWSFHAPIDAVTVPDSRVDTTEKLAEFESTKEFERTAPRTFDGNAEQVLLNIVGLEARLETMGF